MKTKDQALSDMVESYLSEADGWDDRQISRGSGDFYFENSHCIDGIDDDELMTIAECSYNGRRDWPDASSIRDGILQLAVDALAGEFDSLLSSVVSDFEDFESLSYRHPYKDREPDTVYDDNVAVFWDERYEEFVAIKTVEYGNSKFHLNVSGDYDFEEDALLQLKRSAYGHEDGGGGEEQAA